MREEATSGHTVVDCGGMRDLSERDFCGQQSNFMQSNRKRPSNISVIENYYIASAL